MTLMQIRLVHAMYRSEFLNFTLKGGDLISTPCPLGSMCQDPRPIMLFLQSTLPYLLRKKHAVDNG